MANTKITDLTTGGAALSGDEIPINRASGGPLDRKLTVASVTNYPIIYKQGLPMIYASSGTMTGSPNGTGAFTGLTALTGTNVPGRCLMYFPANAIATSSAAGWYFTTLATTTTGTVIDTTPYTPSDTAPVWPSSPTAPTTA